MGRYYYSAISKEKDQIKGSSPTDLIIYSPRKLIFSICLTAFLFSGCATSRPVYFTSEPPGAIVNISGIKGKTPCLLKVPIREHQAKLSLPSGELREVSLEIKETGPDHQARFKVARAASATCRILAVPFLLAGAAGMWYVDRSSGEYSEYDDEDDSSWDHERRQIGLLSIGSFLTGGILYYTGQNLYDMSPPPDVPPQIHVIFSDPNNFKPHGKQRIL